MGQTITEEKQTLKKDLSRDELGLMIINLAKQDLNASFEEEKLKTIYQENFESILKSCGLFDLEVLKRSNREILETAKRKGVQSIVSLTESFDQYLEEERQKKEQELRAFTAKSLLER